MRARTGSVGSTDILSVWNSMWHRAGALWSTGQRTGGLSSLTKPYIRISDILATHNPVLQCPTPPTPGRLPWALGKASELDRPKVDRSFTQHAVLSKFPVTFLCLHTLIYKEGITTVPQNDRAQLQGLELGPKGRAGAPPRQVRGPSAGHPQPTRQSPFSLTSSLWHFLRSCSSRRYLRSSSWLLLLTSSMAWPIWWGRCSAIREPVPPTSHAQLLPPSLTACSLLPALDWAPELSCHTSDFPNNPLGRYCDQTHFTEQETEPQRS